MVCTPDLYYQEFVVDGAELRRYKHKFLKRLDMYYDLKHDEKEQANTKIKSVLKSVPLSALFYAVKQLKVHLDTLFPKKKNIFFKSVTESYSTVLSATLSP